MKPTLIISIRGSHMDDLPGVFMQKILKFLNKTYSKLPVSLCFEGEPGISLEDLKAAVKEKISYGRSRNPRQEYSAKEAEYDRSLYWLLTTANLYKVNFVLSDLTGISKIPFGDPELNAKRPERDRCMANAILKIARETGGIILDFGGSNHIAGIQTLLSQEPEMKDETQVRTHFMCVYSHAAQHDFPAEFRLMQFTGGASRTEYPFGLSFKTTAVTDSVPDPLHSDLSQHDVEQKNREKLFEDFQKTGLVPAIDALLPLMTVASTTPPDLGSSSATLISRSFKTLFV